MELLHFILAAYGMTFIIIHGHIFNKIRPPCKSWGGFGRLFHCHLCMGFWVGVFLWGVSPYTELFTFEYSAVNAFLCGCISAGTSYFLSMVVDDYGHHPTEIAATMSSVTEYAKLKGIKSVTAIWQPHKYSRTIDNLEAFTKCFEGVDRLIILPVWAASEAEQFIDFKDEFRNYDLKMMDYLRREEESVNLCKHDEVIETIDEGLIIGFGAGDITYQRRGEK